MASLPIIYENITLNMFSIDEHLKYLLLIETAAMCFVYLWYSILSTYY